MYTSKLQDILANLITKLGDSAAHYGPQAIDLTARYLHYKALLDLGFGAVALLVSGMLFKLTFISLQKSIKCEEDDEVLWQTCVIISGVVGAIMFGVAVANLLDTPTWIAAFDSRLALVQLAIQTVTK